MRLDHYLLNNKLATTRSKAQEMIKNSLVSVNEKIVTKNSFKLHVDIDLVEVQEHKQYVSRSAHKLAYFLEDLELDLSLHVALDIGSSTGGFTQVLLENSVCEVTAVDVGKGQLDKLLRDDIRVHSFESCDIRNFNTDKKFNIVVSDVAFISLLHIIESVDNLANDKIILLFKPQFEVGREANRDNFGVVTDKEVIEKTMIIFENSCTELGWKLIEKAPSKLTGKQGNQEYCYYYKK